MKYVALLFCLMVSLDTYAKVDIPKGFIQYLGNNNDDHCGEKLPKSIQSINYELMQQGLNFEIAINTCKIHSSKSNLFGTQSITLYTQLSLIPTAKMTKEELANYQLKQQSCLDSHDIKFKADIALRAGNSVTEQIMKTAGFETTGVMKYKAYKLDRCLALDNEFFGDIRLESDSY